MPYLEYEGEASRVNRMGAQFERELQRDRQREEEVGGRRKGDTRRPLAELAHSYPIYPHFYPVMFSNELSPPAAPSRHPTPPQPYPLPPES